MVKRTDFSAVLFDMDGLVLDTESTYRAAWKEAAKEMGHEISESFFRSLSGLPSEEVLLAISVHCGTGFDSSKFIRLSARFWRSYVAVHGIGIKYGFTPLLGFLVQENIPYCLATNSTAANACECLELAGLTDVFSIRITREQVRRGKPAPDLFLTAAERLQVPINRCLVLEDSSVGIEAAARAGAISVLISSNLPDIPPPVGRCCQMMNDLGQLLESLRDHRGEL